MNGLETREDKVWETLYYKLFPENIHKTLYQEACEDSFDGS